jgi:hypothetical protein
MVTVTTAGCRTINREEWHTLHRAARIIVRETAKATQDMMIFGTGATQWGDLGEWQRDGSDMLRHVPIEDIWATQ